MKQNPVATQPKAPSNSNASRWAARLVFALGAIATTASSAHADSPRPDPYLANQAEVRAQVQGCFDATAPGPRVRAQQVWGQLCRRASPQDVVMESTQAYYIRRTEDGIHIRMKTRFLLDDDVPRARKLQIFAKLKECRDQIQDFWAQYGLHYHFNIDSSFAPEAEEPDHETWIQDSIGRSDSGRIFTRERDEDGDFSDRFCQVLLHENGHHFGLPDEYADRDCPSRPYVEPQRYSAPFDVMSDPSHGFEGLAVFPRHMSQILAPLCGG